MHRQVANQCMSASPWHGMGQGSPDVPRTTSSAVGHFSDSSEFVRKNSSRSSSSLIRESKLIVNVDWPDKTAPEPSNTTDPATFFVVPTASLGKLTRANCSRTRNRPMEFPNSSTVTRLAKPFNPWSLWEQDDSTSVGTGVMVGGTEVNVAVGTVVAVARTVGGGVGVAPDVSGRTLGSVDGGTGGRVGKGGGWGRRLGHAGRWVD